MTPIGILAVAKEDLRRAAHFYEDESRGLGREFLAEVYRAFTFLSENPELGAPVRSGLRKWLLRRFPFLILYRAEEHEVLILAVAHQRRDPDSWLGRTS